MKSAAVLAACRTLAEELTEFRFPAPRILAFKVLSHRFGIYIGTKLISCGVYNRKEVHRLDTLFAGLYQRIKILLMSR